MARYYAVLRDDAYLAHYGIKGMKWGIRKARENKNNVALGYHYLRAKMKLNKLKRESNWYIHDVKGDIWGRIADKHKIARALTAARLRSNIHYLKSSDAGDLYMDRRRDKFEKAMNEAFKGTKYDPKRIARQKAKKKEQRKAQIRSALHLRPKTNS